MGLAGRDFPDYTGAIELALRERPLVAAGAEFHYCDLNFILLGEIVRRVAQQPLDAPRRRSLWSLRMLDTGFRPATNLWPRIAPTQRTPDGVLRGVVHDPTARRMGEWPDTRGCSPRRRISWSSPRPVSPLNEGELDGVRVFRRETVRLMTTVQTPQSVLARRGLGWDLDSGLQPAAGQVSFPWSLLRAHGLDRDVTLDSSSRKTFVLL